jgi:hypothetical protein
MIKTIKKFIKKINKWLDKKYKNCKPEDFAFINDELNRKI